MSKFAKIDPKLIREVAAAIEACWNEGSPIAGQTAEAWNRYATIAVRRSRSFARRGVTDADRSGQIHDIALGFVEALGLTPKLAGAAIVDYQYLAEKALDVIRRHNSGWLDNKHPEGV